MAKNSKGNIGSPTPPKGNPSYPGKGTHGGPANSKPVIPGNENGGWGNHGKNPNAGPC